MSWYWFLIAALCAVIWVVLWMIIWNRWVAGKAVAYIYDDIGSVPPMKTALVLGTAKRSAAGFPNPYFAARIEAAAYLYANNKIRHLIVSGSGKSSKGNEALDMKNALIKHGVPENAIILDEEGYRTLASLLRCRDVFHQPKAILISQKFHLERSVFMGRILHMDVIGYCAKSVRGTHAWRMDLREYLARLKCLVDLVLLFLQGKLHRHEGGKV